MLWASERRQQLRFGIALRRIQLGLDEKDTPGEVGTSEVGISEVGPDKVGHSQVGASEVGAFEFGSDEVGSSVVLLLVPDFGSHERTRAQKQDIDVSSVYCQVQFHESI